MKHKIKFTDGNVIEAESGENFIENMDVMNSPVLFGCRTGICATCIVKVLEGSENLPPISDKELEVIDMYTKEPNCRLACQINVTGNVKLQYIGK